MSFYYLNQNAKNVSSPFENFGQNDGKFNLENFESMPPIDPQKSDTSYQCSDNVQITGNAIGSSIPNSTLANCKTQCKSEASCIGFDFDNSSSSCTLRNTITDLTSSKQNNVMCVKKTSSACKLNPQVDPANEAALVIGENSEQENRPSSSSSSSSSPSASPEIPGLPVKPPGGSTPEYPPQTPPQTKPIPTPTPPSKSEQCKADTIFVDLPCFLNKMDVLKNHSDNLMIDLQLLITNLKSCSYVKKPVKKPAVSSPFKSISSSSSSSSSSDDLSVSGDFNFNFGASSESSSTVSNSNIPVIMPTQDTIKVYNSQASVLYTNNPSNGANVMLGITEPFENSGQAIAFYNTFSFKLVVLVLLVVILMNLK